MPIRCVNALFGRMKSKFPIICSFLKSLQVMILLNPVHHLVKSLFKQSPDGEIINWKSGIKILTKLNFSYFFIF